MSTLSGSICPELSSKSQQMQKSSVWELPAFGASSVMICLSSVSSTERSYRPGKAIPLSIKFLSIVSGAEKYSLL
jgi:hypothetical protein